jgi:crotonobetainyl-CoA:carnitine CoA-transferase CaiB-like acyl-CoA transferase
LSERPGLLSGVRVLSFGSFVAGNTAATLLADLGAEVAKIEPKSRPEVLRMPAYAIGEAVTEPSGVPNTVMYASLTRGLRNVSLDLANVDAQRLFHRLAGVTDIVIENFGSPVLERWGCGYHDVLPRRPNLVWLSLSGYGRDGPRANYLAYGVTVASYLGLASAWGYSHGTLSDYVAAASGALASVAALGQARREGTPAYLDIAQIDAVPPLLASLYTSSLNAGIEQVETSSGVGGSWLSGVFATRGHDQWLAIDLEDHSDWDILCSFLGRPELQTSDRDQAALLEPQLSEALGSWVSQCGAHTAMHHLQRAGLAAGVVQDMEDLWRDLQVRARGLPVQVWQPDLGSVTYTGSAQRWSKTPGSAPVPPARLGQHTRDVLKRWLGTTNEELRSLEEGGAVFSAE